jgi:subtilisin family serine protease
MEKSAMSKIRFERIVSHTNITNKGQGREFLRIIVMIVGLVMSFAAVSEAKESGSGSKPRLQLNDPLFSEQQALFAKINVLEAWNITKGDPNVLVGVIDNGFDFFHPDLKGQLIPGFYAPGGYHTEIYINNAHGTLVSSIIRAKENNEIGMAGLAPGCRILASSHGMIEHFLLRLRSEYMKEHPDAGLAEGMKELAKHRLEAIEFGNNWGEYMTESIAEAIRYSVDHGVRVINFSGVLDVWRPENRDKNNEAFAYAAKKDVIIVIGAGNLATEVKDYPGDESHTIVAGATMLNDERWEEEVEVEGMKQSIKQGSNYGKRLTVMAPVENLVVCVPHETRFYSADDSPAGATDEEFKGMYETMPNGATSSAAPIVTSLVALVYSVRPDLDAESAIEIIKQGCDDIGDKGYDIYTGHGRVNFGKTIKIALAWRK